MLHKAEEKEEEKEKEKKKKKKKELGGVSDEVVNVLSVNTGDGE